MNNFDWLPWQLIGPVDLNRKMMKFIQMASESALPVFTTFCVASCV